MRRERRASNLNPGWRHALATQAPQANQREKQVPGKEGACPLSSLQEFPYSTYHKPAPAPGLGARGPAVCPHTCFRLGRHTLA